jgi:hypothetical protein
VTSGLEIALLAIAAAALLLDWWVLSRSTVRFASTPAGGI